METLILNVEKRTVVGSKQAKKLRTKGLLPGNIFGKEFTSMAIQFPVLEFQKIFKKAHKTKLIYLDLSGKRIPVLVAAAQKDPLKNLFLHVDFRKMDLKEVTETEVPVEYTGELGVVKTGEADVLLLANTLLVKCLPTEIPEKIVIDISKLEGVGAEVRVSDLPKVKTYEFVEEPEKIVLQISEAQKEEVVGPVVVDESEEAASETKEGEEKEKPDFPNKEENKEGKKEE